MTIELKQAAQQALDAFEAFGEADDFATLFTLTQKMNALRTTIQQASTAESGPVARAWAEGYRQGIEDERISEANIGIAGFGAKVNPNRENPYANSHPAPGVPDDSKRLDYLQDRGATIDLIPGVAGFYPMRFRVGGLHSSANIDVRAAIDAAMLAAKGEPNV